MAELKGVDVAVSVLARKHVFVFGECIEVGVVLQEAPCELTVSRTCAALCRRGRSFQAACSFRPRCRTRFLWGRAIISSRLRAFGGR